MFKVEYQGKEYKGCRFRLIAPNGKHSAWMPYDEFATIDYNGATYMVCTDFWKDTFPANRVFALLHESSVQTIFFKD